MKTKRSVWMRWSAVRMGGEQAGEVKREEEKDKENQK